MSDLLAVTTRYLRDAEFQVSELAEGPFVFVAQNLSALAFGVRVTSSLTKTMHDVIGLLSTPFLAKSFGPKTMEMYVLFLGSDLVSAEEVSNCERDIRVCRKIVLLREGDVEARLLFLKPIVDTDASTVDPDRLFWSELSRQATPEDLALLAELEKGLTGEGGAT